VPHSKDCAVIAEEDLVTAMLGEPEGEGTFFRGDEATAGLEEAVKDQDGEATPSIGAWAVARVDDTVYAGTFVRATSWWNTEKVLTEGNSHPGSRQFRQ